MCMTGDRTYCQHSSFPYGVFLLAHPEERLLLEGQQRDPEASGLLGLLWDNDADVLLEISPDITKLGMMPLQGDRVLLVLQRTLALTMRTYTEPLTCVNLRPNLFRSAFSSRFSSVRVTRSRSQFSPLPFLSKSQPIALARAPVKSPTTRMWTEM